MSRFNFEKSYQIWVFLKIALATSCSKYSSKINIFWSLHSVFTSDHQVKKVLKMVKQNVFSQFHTRINIIMKYCRLLTIQYRQPCICAYSTSNIITNGSINKWKICIWVNGCYPICQLKNLMKQSLQQNVQILWFPCSCKLKNNLHWTKDLTLGNFRFLCSSRSHKRSKFSGKCNPTFCPSRAWRSVGSSGIFGHFSVIDQIFFKWQKN